MDSFKKVTKEECQNFIRGYYGVEQWNQTIADRIDFKQGSKLLAYKDLIDGCYYILNITSDKE